MTIGTPPHSPLLIIISAPSGAGKTSLCNQLLKDFKDRLALSVSCTTRAPRKGDVHGREYFFITQDEFEKKIQAGEFAEWAQVHGNYYGTLKSTIEDCWKRKASVLLEIDVQGATSLRKAFPGRCYSVFISPPSLKELERRLRGRGTENEETIQRRLTNARAEMARSNEFDKNIVNDRFDRSYSELKECVSLHA